MDSFYNAFPIEQKRMGNISLWQRALILIVASTAFGAVAIGDSASPPNEDDASVQTDSTGTAGIQREFAEAMGRLHGILGASPRFEDANWRSTTAAQAIPVLKTLLKDANELTIAAPKSATQFSILREEVSGMLVAFGDSSTSQKVEAEAKSADPRQAVEAQIVEFTSRWCLAGDDVAVQGKIVGDLSALDAAHPNSSELAAFTSQVYGNAPASIKPQLQALLCGTLTSPEAIAVKQRILATEEETQKLNALVGKPLVIKGTTIDGNDFTTGDLKGKVILVDFWASWCVSCVVELPRVKRAYSTFHSKGLEIVGVSNDFDADRLTQFVAGQKLSWTQLFDADAAADHALNPTTLGFGIISIPQMFLIDKRGIVRSVTARQDMDTLIPKLLAEAN